jgi:hypothetical protein
MDTFLQTAKAPAQSGTLNKAGRFESGSRSSYWPQDAPRPQARCHESLGCLNGFYERHLVLGEAESVIHREGLLTALSC